MSLTTQEAAAIVADYATKEGDTGSPQVQVALLTHNINKLQGHFKSHKKITTHVVVYYVWFLLVVNY